MTDRKSDGPAPASLPQTLIGLPKSGGQAEKDSRVVREYLDAKFRRAQARAPRPEMTETHKRLLADIKADGRLRSRLASVGSQRTSGKDLRSAKEGEEDQVNNPDLIAAHDRDGMIMSLWATLEWARERKLPAHDLDNLMALYEGLTLVRDGVYYYAFQPTNPKGKQIGDTQLLRRAYVAAAIKALIEAGKNKPERGKTFALKEVAERMHKDARRADFALKANAKITPEVMAVWYGDFTRRRGVKGSLDGTAAKAQFEKLVTKTIPDTLNAEGPEALATWAANLLNAVINRLAPQV
jgi:hypothetical protein